MRYRLHKLLNGPVGSMQVEHLDRGPTKFDDDLHVGFLRGDLKFTRLIDSVMVRGQVDTEVTVQCVRSLEDFDLQLSVLLDDILFALAGRPTDEPDRQITDDGWIDLTETLREEIIMAIPFNPINPAFADPEAAEATEGLSDKDREWLTVKWGNDATNDTSNAATDGNGNNKVDVDTDIDINDSVNGRRG
jgi:hypothetical protein